MQSVIGAHLIATETVKISMSRIWTGWSISSLIIAFLIFDIVGKFAKPTQVVDALARTGWPVELSPILGAILLVCTVLYVIPQTSVLGAILLTGYLGGAVATNLRLENPLFSHTLFPVYFGVLAWVGLWLRDTGLRTLFPFVI
jgi:hypothetical protein